MLARYLFGFPFACLFAAASLTILGLPVPPLSIAFLVYSSAGAITQMAGTALLILSFGHCGFVAGTAFSKTEAIQVALVTALFLDEQLPLLAWPGIIVDVTGVLILALVGQGVTARQVWKVFRQPAALCGLGAGSMFACAAMTIKLATAELSGVDTVGSALVALVVVMAIRSSLHLAWSSLRDHRDIARWQTVVPNVESAWPAFGGRVRMLDIGFAAAPAALVRIVGQVEIIFTIAFARYYLRDKVRVQEMLGLLLVAAGVIMALLAAA